jgi:hypothetical protein
MTETGGERIQIAEGGSPTETPKIVEKSDSRETVINTFKSVISLMQASEASLRAEDKTALRIAKAGAEKTIDQQKDTFTNSFPSQDGSITFNVEEGIPVDGLLAFLIQKSQSQPLTDEKKKEYKDQFKILIRNSQKYIDKQNSLDPEQFIGRISQEAFMIHHDERKGIDDKADWYRAINELSRRRELIIPAINTEPLIQQEQESPGQPTSPETNNHEKSQALALNPAPSTETSTDTGSDEKQPPTITSPAPTPEPAPPSEPEPAEKDKSEVTPPALAPSKEETNPESDIPDESKIDNSPISPDISQPPEKIDFVIANRSLDIRTRARDIVEKMIRHKMTEGSLWNPKTWMRRTGLRIFEEGYRQRQIQRVEAAMIANHNSCLDWDITTNALRDANARRFEEKSSGDATIERVKQDQMIAGENKVILGGELKDTLMNDIIKPVITNGHDQAWIQDRLRQFVQTNAAHPQIQSVFGRDATQYGNLADYFATDIHELGQKIKQDIDSHKFTLEMLDELSTVQLANTRWAAETDIKYGAVDKLIALAQKNKATGLIFNPAVIGASASLATFFSLKAPTAALRLADLATPGIGALGGGLFTSARRVHEVNIDRSTHQKERAYGGEIPSDAPRREALEKYQYDIASVSDLLEGSGTEAITGRDRISIDNLINNYAADQNDINRDAIYSRITEITERLDTSALQKIDLIRFGGEFQTETSRLNLLNAVARLKNALGDVNPNELENKLIDFAGQWNDHFLQDKDQKNKQFKKYRVLQALQSGVFGAAVGMGSALATQEGLALISRGLGIPSGSGPTVVEKTLGLDTIPKSTTSLINELTTKRSATIGSLSMSLDNNDKVIINSINGATYTGPVPDITINTADNTFVFHNNFDEYNLLKFDELETALQKSGFGIIDVDYTPTKLATISKDQFLPQVSSKIDGVEWYGYNTRPSDFNELKLHNWKTPNGTGVTFSMSKMDQMSYSNRPAPQDVPEIIKSGHGIFSFWDPKDPSHPILLKADSQGFLTLDKAASPGKTVEIIRNGKAELMPEATLARMILGNLDNFIKDSDSTKHTEILNLKCSAGALFEKNGKTTFGSFATINGTGTMPESIDWQVPDPKTTLTPPNIPQTPVDTSPPPLIPIPGAPRKPLEELTSQNNRDNDRNQDNLPVNTIDQPSNPGIDDNAVRNTDQPQDIQNRPADQPDQTDNTSTPEATDKTKQLLESKPQIPAPLQDFIDHGKGKIGNISAHLEGDTKKLIIDKIGDVDYTGEQKDVTIDFNQKTLSSTTPLLDPPYNDIASRLQAFGYRTIITAV